MTKLVAIVITYNREDFIGKCIRSILDAASDERDVTVIVMDNGSTDDTPKIAASLGERVRLERTGDNRQVTSVVNRGLRIALRDTDADYIILMNDDTEWVPGGLQHLLEVARGHPHALLAPLQLKYRERDEVDSMALGLAKQNTALLEDALLGRPLKDVYPVRTIVGAGMAAARSVWERLGYWDELYEFYGPDDDYCNRALLHGYKVLLVPRAHLLHAHGKLNEEVRSENVGSNSQKWRLETEMRYMALLKNPDRPYSRCIADCAAQFLADEALYLVRLWPQGMWLALQAYWTCVRKLPQVRAARLDHFHPARSADAES